MQMGPAGLSSTSTSKPAGQGQRDRRTHLNTQVCYSTVGLMPTSIPLANTSHMATSKIKGGGWYSSLVKETAKAPGKRQMVRSGSTIKSDKVFHLLHITMRRNQQGKELRGEYLSKASTPTIFFRQDFVVWSANCKVTESVSTFYFFSSRTV